jgi:hypothetical protein
MSPFSVKDWKDFPDTTTPITAAALEDLEDRVADYADGALRPGFPSGKWVRAVIGDTNDAAVTNGRLYFGWLPVTRNATFDRIGCRVSTGDATLTVRLGIYTDDGFGKPNTKVLDAGTVDGTASGAKEIVISQALTAGNHWLAAQPEFTAGTPALRMSNAFATSQIWLVHNDPDINRQAGWYGANTGALPASAPALTLTSEVVAASLRAA